MSKIKSPKNVKQLRTELCKLFQMIGNNEADVAAAKEMNNAAGKIINSVKIQLEYAALNKQKPNIKFMDTPEEG